MSTCVAITYPCCLGTPGGGPVHCQQLALNLKAQGARVIVLPVAVWWGTRKATQPNSQELRLADSSIEVVRVNPHPIHYTLDGLEIRKRIAAITARTRVDAVLSWWTEGAFLPGFLRSRRIAFGIVAATSYAERFGRQRTPLGFLRDQFALWRPLRNADAVYANSEFTRKEVIELARAPEDRVLVTHCGIEPGFREIQRVYSGPAKRFIFYGNLVATKGIFDAIIALGRLKKQGLADWRLKIAGWGDAQAVRECAQKHGVDGHIELLGTLDRNRLAAELEWAQLAILPSYFESFGLATAESQASGLPVVAYAVGGISDIVDSGKTGWLVPRARIDLLAEAIREAIDNPEQTFQRGMAGRRRSETFSWDRVAGNILMNITQQVSRLR